MCKTVPEGQQSSAFVFVVCEGTAYWDSICCESLSGGFSHSSLGIATLSLNTLYNNTSVALLRLSSATFKYCLQHFI